MATMRDKPNASAETSSVEDEGAASRPDDRRSYDRFDVEWAVDCVAEDTFLFASITNISAMGIFVKTVDPLALGTRLMLTFEPPGYEPFKLQAEVAWINPVRSNGDNPNPGMGVRFIHLRPDDRERLVEVIRTIAYVREPA
ncbi:MAG: TIGR02266 family protein [Polyangiaceae bacterium]|jgi:type IV pilus assembly protein PilZ